MRQPTTHGLYQYWNAVRNGRLAPRRYEIEPSQIVPFLSETLILEDPTGDCRIRILGTQLGDWLGDDLRNQRFLDLWSPSDQVVLRDNIHTIARHGAVGLYALAGAHCDDVPLARFEMLLLPLTHHNDRVERLLGSISALSAPEWLATAPPNRLNLSSNEIIWPDGRPQRLTRRFATPFTMRSEPPSLRPQPGYRRARLVRQERRSFLVYDGGLADSTSDEQ